EPYLTLARIYVEQKQYDKARAVLLRLVEQQPRLAQAQFLLGRLAIETENWDEAIARLTAAGEIAPDHDGAWSALGADYCAARGDREGGAKEEGGDRSIPQRGEGQPGQPGIRRQAGRPADPPRAPSRGPDRARGARRGHAAKPACMDEARRGLLRAEDVGQGG